MMVRFVPRSSWYDRPDDRPVMNNGTSLRPPMLRPAGLAVHYTGAPWSPTSSARRLSAADYLRDRQRKALAGVAGIESFEYNYIIPPGRPIGEVWEYAGLYRGAHAGPANPGWIGVQFMIGVNNHPSFAGYDRTRPTVWEPLTDEMIEAFRWLRHRLIELGAIAPNTLPTEHGKVPGNATTCPGDAVRGRWVELIKPYQPTPAPPEEIPDMQPDYFKLGPTDPAVWRTTDGLTAVHIGAEQFPHLGVDPAKIRVMPRAEQLRITFLIGTHVGVLKP